jgi:hypothetical protein
LLTIAAIGWDIALFFSFNVPNLTLSSKCKLRSKLPALALLMALPAGKTIVTTHLDTNFLKPA